MYCAKCVLCKMCVVQNVYCAKCVLCKMCVRLTATDKEELFSASLNNTTMSEMSLRFVAHCTFHVFTRDCNKSLQ